jgi:hypothetical protein
MGKNPSTTDLQTWQSSRGFPFTNEINIPNVEHMLLTVFDTDVYNYIKLSQFIL